MLAKVINGGLPGVEIAALRAARAAKLATGGWYLPGCAPMTIQLFGLRGHVNGGALDRLVTNIADAEATLALAEDLDGAGVQFVRERCRLSTRPCLVLPLDALRDTDHMYEQTVRQAVSFLQYITLGMIGYSITIHVTGAREKDSPGVQELTEPFLREVFDRLDP